MNGFDFYMNGFKTRYTAQVHGQVYRIFAGKKDTGIHYEHGELKSLMERQVILKAFDEENV